MRSGSEQTKLFSSPKPPRNLPETSPKQRRIHLTRAPCRKNPQDSEVERIYSRLRATFLVLKGSQKAGATGCWVNLPAEWLLEAGEELDKWRTSGKTTPTPPISKKALDKFTSCQFIIYVDDWIRSSSLTGRGWPTTEFNSWFSNVISMRAVSFQ